MVSFNVAIQAYAVIFAVITKDQSGYLGDRYSCALYRSLMEPNLDQCSRKAVYLNLLYKSMKADSVNKRTVAFVKRLLQVCFHQPANITAGVLMLISSVLKDKPDLRKELINNFNKLAIENPLLKEEDEEEKFYDQDDDDEEEAKPVNKGKSRKKQKKSDESGDESDEKEEASRKKVESNKNQKKSATTSGPAVASSWVHLRNTSQEKNKLRYDALHRNPLYANADQAKPFELCILRHHFHPTVSHFTENLVQSKKIEYDGDALYDFNVKSFLDKFVYKNPKKVTKADKKASQEQALFERSRRHLSQRIQINGPGYVNQAETAVPVEERFIYNFLKNKSKYEDDDNASITSDDFSQFVLNRFEKSFDNELSADILAGRKRKRRNSEDEDDDEDAMLGDDDDLGLELDQDPEYADALKNYVDDLNLNEIRQSAVDGKEEQAGDGLEIDDELSEDDEEEDDDGDDDDDDDDDDEEGEGDDKKSGGKNKRDRGLMDLLASADEFAHLLEENEDMEESTGARFDGNLEEFGGGNDDDEEEDALNFDDDEDTLASRKSRTKSRKEKTEKDAKIHDYKNKKKQKIVAEEQKKQQKKKPTSGQKFGKLSVLKGRFSGAKQNTQGKKNFGGKKFTSKKTGNGPKFNRKGPQSV